MSNLIEEGATCSLGLPLLADPMQGQLSEDYLLRRFRRPAAYAAKTIYEFTPDAALMQQYVQMREEMFISVWGLKHFSGHHDAYDDISHVMVARRGNQCIAGGRLTVCQPHENMLLPLEKQDFHLPELFPEYHLSSRCYGEFSRLAILPEYRAGAVFPEIARRFIKKAVAAGVEYAFNMAPRPLARNYRQTMQLFGLRWDIRDDVKVPDREEFEGIGMVLSVMDLTAFKRRHPLETSRPSVLESAV